MENLNIQNEVKNLLELVKELEGRYTKNYITKILKGNTTFISLEHQKLAQFGSLKEWTYSQINSLFDFLSNKEYLILNNQHKGTYQISQRGINYLNKSTEFWIKDYELKPSKKHYYVAIKALKDERKRQAEEKGLSTYELCSNFQLEQLVINDFKTVEELLKHPFYLDWEGKIDWERMLLRLKEVKNEYYQVKNLKRRKTYDKIQNLINQNASINDIIKCLNIKVSTLLNYVESIYENGNENLKLWIYKNVDKKQLVKCVEYFTRTKNLKLKEAKEQLQLDYEIIRLGRIYYRLQQITVAA